MEETGLSKPWKFSNKLYFIHKMFIIIKTDCTALHLHENSFLKKQKCTIKASNSLQTTLTLRLEQAAQQPVCDVQQTLLALILTSQQTTSKAFWEKTTHPHRDNGSKAFHRRLISWHHRRRNARILHNKTKRRAWVLKAERIMISQCTKCKNKIYNAYTATVTHNCRCTCVKCISSFNCFTFLWEVLTHWNRVLAPENLFQGKTGHTEQCSEV